MGLIDFHSVKEKELSVEDHLNEVLAGQVGVGKQWSSDEIRLTIREMKNNRITQVLVERLI